MRSLLWVVGCGEALAAHASEPFFTHQGRLTDGLGQPVDGARDLQVGLYDAATGGADCWVQDFDDVDVEQGYFGLHIAGLDATGRALDAVATGCRWLATSTVGGPEIGARQRMPDYYFGDVEVPLASDTVAGLVEAATPAQVAAGTDVGETGARLFVPPSLLPQVPVGASMPTFSTLDGTPRAVGLLGGSTALSFAWASGGVHTTASGSNQFLGFSSATTTRPGHQLLNYASQGNGATYTAPAGANRYLLVYIANQNGSQTGHNVTGVSFGGVAMTNLASLGTTGIVGGVDSGGFYLYGMPLGTSATTTSGAITATFNAAGAATIQAHTFGNIDQTTPVAHAFASGHGATTNPSTSVGGLFHGTELEAYGTYDGQNKEGFGDTVGGLQHASVTAPGRTIRVYKNSTSNWSGYLVMVALRPAASATSAPVQMSGTVPGFTGLTPGAVYYLSSTVGGGISTTPVGAPIGVAVSATELFLLPRS
jgi:hypothetical protein